MTPDDQDPVTLWTSRAFVDEARAWVEAQLAPHGIRLTGQWEQPHVRVWSTTIRFETTEGVSGSRSMAPARRTRHRWWECSASSIRV